MYDVVTFGEAMLRLSPPDFKWLEQITILDRIQKVFINSGCFWIKIAGVPTMLASCGYSNLVRAAF